MALNRALRLRKGSEFQRVRQQGRSLTSRLLVLAWAPYPDEVRKLRVGFVVSKRISKLAVERNYIKRLLGEALRPYLSKILGEWDIVFSARSSAATADLHTLEQEVVNLLKRARLLEPENDTE